MLKKMSLKIQLIFWWIVILFPLALIAILGNVYTVYSSMQMERERQQNVLDYTTNEIENKMRAIQSYAVDWLTNSSDAEVWFLYQKQNEGVLAKYRIINKISNDKVQMKSLRNMIFFNQHRNPDEFLMLSCMGDEEDWYKKQLYDSVLEVIQDNLFGIWHVYQVAEQYLFLNVGYSVNGYVCAVVDADSLFSSYGDVLGDYFVTDETNDQIIYDTHSYEYSLYEQENVSKDTLPGIRCSISVISDSDNMHFFGSFFQMSLLILTIIGMVLIPIMLIVFSRRYVRPIYRLSEAMNEIKSENLDISLDEDVIPKEFRDVNSTFNSMVKEIKQLRIDVYEEILERKNLEIAQLQAQAKPHFYLNSLNVIYSMVQCDEKTEVLRLLRSLANYCRFSMDVDKYFVSIEEELQFVESYVEIQKVRYGEKVQCHIWCEDALRNVSIPTMLLEEFVYNSFKYGFNMTDVLEIHIHIERVDNDIHMTISDNGPGYSEEALKNLMTEKSVEKGSGRHIGIHNTIKRIKYFYNEKAAIDFKNKDEGGAVVEIRIPLSFKGEEQS